MEVMSFLENCVGQWQGSYKLWLDPSQEPATCDTTLVVKPTANGAYFLIHYDWSFQGDGKAGLFLIGGKEEQAQATWGDSFHMEPLPMICDGEMKGNGLVLNGSYPAGDEQWGWRTELSHESGNLLMRAYNIMPSGKEDIALEAIYQAHA